MNDLEIMRNIKRQLIRKRQEIDAMKNGEEKNKALKAYAELLTSLEMGTFKGPTPTRQPSHTKKPFKIQGTQVAAHSLDIYATIQKR